MDCPLYVQAKEKCAFRAESAKAAARKEAAAVKAAAAAAAKAVADAAAAAELLQRWTQYDELRLSEGVAEPSRSQFTESNWELVTDKWHCPFCRGTRAWCICHELV